MEEEIKKALDTNKEEILEAISIFSTHMDKRFDGVENRLDGVENRLDGVENRLDGVENRLDGVKSEIKVLENKMVDGFSSIRTEIAEVKREIIARIEKLEKRDKEDTDALSKNYLELETRVKKLEQQLNQLQTA